MFTGLIQQIGIIENIQLAGQNKTFEIKMTQPWQDIKIDESISHNGICLTVVDAHNDTYRVTAIQETLQKTTADTWAVGNHINLERAMKAEERLGGHFVLGHVDGLAQCVSVEDRQGSQELTFEIPEEFARLIVEKGSICLNGISLTIFQVTKNTFKVAIIPYTWEVTNLHHITAGDEVNVEYDIIGKYMSRSLELYERKSVV